jgi:hypothetical protein
MIQPQRIGRFIGVDEFGYVKPDVAIDHIGAIWKPLVSFVTDALMNRPGVRAVYLRGSIPRGLAIENISDADFIYLSDADFDWADAVLGQALEAKFPFVRGFEFQRIDRATFAKIYPPQQRPFFHMLLKTQCLFLAGDDITRDIEPFRIGLEMVSHAFMLLDDFSRLEKWLQEGRRRGAEQVWRQWFSRRIVRSGFEVTMDRRNRFTRDLYLCFEQFSEFYPDHSEQMFRVLANCLNGGESPFQFGELVAFLSRESERLTVPAPEP